MGDKEKIIEKLTRLSLPEFQRMVRFNVAGKGACYCGEPSKIKRNYYDSRSGEIGVFIPNGRPITVGKKSWADFIGYTEIEINEEMVGEKIAVFTAAEIKSENDTFSEGQLKFKNQILKSGGIHETWRSTEREIKKGWEYDIK